MAWRPILEGPIAEEARASIEGVARQLEHMELPATARGASLAHGSAGIAVFFGELAQEWNHPAAHAAAARHLSRAMDVVSDATMSASLFEGLSGVAWAVEHLAGDPASLDEIDRALLTFLENPETEVPHELYNGLVGIGLYGLVRGRRVESGMQIALRVVNALSMRAERDDDGVTWSTAAADLPPGESVDEMSAHYNMGMAHGLAGVLAFLARAWTAGIEEAGWLVDATSRWLLAHRLDDDSPTRYPSWIEPGKPPRPARAAWCYGDAVIARALMAAADATGRPELRDEAAIAAHLAASRPASASGIADAGLCHGSTGFAHILNRLHQGSGDPDLADAARVWFEHALDVRGATPGGIAGFSSWATDGPGTPFAWRTDPGFLTGASGIALALLAATSPNEPMWDAVLLLDGL